ncbi:MAG: CRISPR-associated endonuclease Cas1 [Spirosomataceae bacterium]
MRWTSTPSSLLFGATGYPRLFCDYYGNYTATLYPQTTSFRGHLSGSRRSFISVPRKRLVLAQAFVEAALFNIERVIKYYQPRLEGEAKTAVQATLQALVRDRETSPKQQTFRP